MALLLEGTKAGILYLDPFDAPFHKISFTDSMK